MKRILTVSSGKGGVGKTTFAINFALSLSTVAPTVLVDLDTGTSSIRNSIDAPVTRDLYHFFRKNVRLAACVTPLPDSLDRAGRYGNFGFIAGPRHMIDEITNFGAAAKGRLIRAINRLPATYVVLDMKAGLDANVIDFLPYSNSGILIFTPQLPAATLAASDIVKAILFRKLRILFAPDSPVYRRVSFSPHDPRMINDLLDSVEDVYDESIPNIDAFLADLGRNLGDSPLLALLHESVEDFRVYYVLNMFNGVRESYETAVEPFVTNLVENVSARLKITNLGWIIKNDAVHDANRRRCPVLLTPDPAPASPRVPTAVEREILSLEKTFLTSRAEPPSPPPTRGVSFRAADPRRALDRQIDSLRSMYADQQDADVRENFSYVTHRALHLIDGVRASEFGDTRICGRDEILAHLLPDSPPDALTWPDDADTTGAFGTATRSGSPMSTVETIQPKTIKARKIHKNLSGTELRALARSEETTSAYGSPVYTTRIKNRSAKDTFVVENGVTLGKFQKGMEPERAVELVRTLQESLADREIIQVDRRMGMAPQATLHCRLFVPVEFARIAAMWHNMLFPINSEGTPDFVSVYIPDWPEKIIFLDPTEGYTYICGTDYPGEAKKSMLRQAMYWMKKRGGLGLHAGSKILRVTGSDGKLHDVGFLLFGLSGTGKTTLTLHDHGLREPERVIIKQDDVVLLDKDGRAFGTEDGFYIKTEGLEPSQRVLWDAAISPSACFENVKVKEDGTIDFCDTSLTSNGRGVVLRKFIHGTDDGIDLPKANKIIFITRRNDVVPVVAKLTPEQGAAFFMLGESIETSAGDPTKAGQAKREVGTNPFIVGPEEEEGNRILGLLRDHPEMEAYILNTGSVGARNGFAGEKITIQTSTEIMKQIARNGITWEKDPDWGYEVASDVPGVDLSPYDPRSHYSDEEYDARIARLRREREDWLAQFSGLDSSIPSAIRPEP